MQILNYNLEHDEFNEVVTIFAETNKGAKFHFTFSDTHTLREVKNKLLYLANEIDNGPQDK